MWAVCLARCHQSWAAGEVYGPVLMGGRPGGRARRPGPLLPSILGRVGVWGACLAQM